MKSNNVHIPDEAIVKFIGPNEFKKGCLRWRRVEDALPYDGCTAKEIRALPLMLAGTLGRWFSEFNLISIDGVSFKAS